MTENKKDGGLRRDLLPIAIGEGVVALLVCGGFLIAQLLGVYTFDYKIVTGALLGAAVIIGNHLWLCLTVDKRIKQYLETRGSAEMSEEEAEAFTKKHTAAIQRAMSTSSIIRTVSIFAALIVAFITGLFNPLATAIPMFALRPLLTVTELIKSKNNPKPDPSKFIKYEDEDENNSDEKEDN